MIFAWRKGKKQKNNLRETNIFEGDEAYIEPEITMNVEEDKESDDKASEMSRALMVYIGDAIDKWAKEYDMQSLPKNIVFKKALTLMNAWDKIGTLK